MVRNTAAILGLGVVVGFACAQFVSSDALQAQAPQVRVEAKTCNVPRAFGALRSTWEQWLVFEDDEGLIRAVDDRCAVRAVVHRQ